MPIYEYRCASCGHQEEFLQKLSDPPHTRCPKCGEESFSKMLSAAGFQLKGSGWYATDFKGGSAGKPAVTAEKTSEKTAGTVPDTKVETKTETKPQAASATAVSKSEPASTKA